MFNINRVACFIAALTCTVCFALADVLQTGKIPEDKESEKFFIMNEGLLHFRSISVADEKLSKPIANKYPKIFKVSLSDLSVIPTMNQSDKVTAWDLSDVKRHEFPVGTSCDVVLRKELPEGSNSPRDKAILLTSNPQVLAKYAIGFEEDNGPSGLAYVGSRAISRDFSMSEVHLKELKKDDALWGTKQLSGMTNIKVAKLLSFEIYMFASPGKDPFNKLVIRNPGGETLNSSLNFSSIPRSLKVYSLFDDGLAVVLTYNSGEEFCPLLLLFDKTDVSRVHLPCPLFDDSSF